MSDDQRPPMTAESLPGGGGTVIRNPNREYIMLITWKHAIQLEAKGVRLRHSTSISTMAKKFFNLPRNTDRLTILDHIHARIDVLTLAMFGTDTDDV